MGKDIVISKLDFFVLVFGQLITIGLAWHMYIMFIRAYLDPQKGIVLLINVFGEANNELILLTLSMALGTITTVYILWFLRGLRKDKITVGMKDNRGK